MHSYGDRRCQDAMGCPTSALADVIVELAGQLLLA